MGSCSHSSESKVGHENEELLPKVNKSISVVLKHPRKMSAKDARLAETSPLKREP